MSDAPIENVAVEGGKKCPAGKVKDAVSGRCRKRKCGRGRTRSGSGRCHRLKKSGPHRENAPSSRRVRGGEEAPVVVGGYQGGRRQMGGGEDSLLTAGALEEAFQAGLEAGKRHKKSHKKSRKSRSRKSRSRRGRKHARGGEVEAAAVQGGSVEAIQGGSVEAAPVEAPVQA